MGTENATTENRPRLIARILRDVLASQGFDSLADLLDVLKERLARYRIPWTNDEFNDALAWIASNRPLLVAPEQVARVERPSDALTKDQTLAVLATLRAKLGPIRIKRMPVGDPIVTRRTVDREKAMRMVLDEIDAAVARCDALEREDE